MRNLLSLTAAGVLVLTAGATWCWWELRRPTTPPQGGAVISVAPGEAFRSTAAKLEQAGVVRHGWLLHRYASWAGHDRLIRTGDYRFEEPIAPMGVLEALRSAAQALNRVTIPEGFSVQQIAAQLEAAGFGGADEFLCAAQDTGFLTELEMPPTGLEGHLFPDTYSFPLRTSPRDILRAMVKRFRVQVATLEEERQSAGLSELDMLVLASIVEKETGIAEERALVASVFHNRLRIGMKLQSDPTAVYGWKNGPPTAADLKVDNPHNTYVYGGLPPGPICNPGIAAMRAALQPEPSSYFFFVARADGTHAFSTTLEEHNRAVAELRRHNSN